MFRPGKRLGLFRQSEEPEGRKNLKVHGVTKIEFEERNYRAILYRQSGSSKFVEGVHSLQTKGVQRITLNLSDEKNEIRAQKGVTLSVEYNGTDGVLTIVRSIGTWEI